MIHAMIYKPTEQSPELTVHVYHFQQTEDLDCFATCWVPSKECWLITPVHTLIPKTKKKKVLTESKEKN